MADDEVTRATEALKAIAKRAATDKRFRERLQKDPLGLMQAAGMSLSILSGIAKTHDVGDEDARRLGLALSDIDGTDFIATNMCVGTCAKQTLYACGGCKNSIKKGDLHA